MKEDSRREIANIEGTETKIAMNAWLTQSRSLLYGPFDLFGVPPLFLHTYLSLHPFLFPASLSFPLHLNLRFSVSPLFFVSESLP